MKKESKETTQIAQNTSEIFRNFINNIKEAPINLIDNHMDFIENIYKAEVAIVGDKIFESIKNLCDAELNFYMEHFDNGDRNRKYVVLILGNIVIAVIIGLTAGALIECGGASISAARSFLTRKVSKNTIKRMFVNAMEKVERLIGRDTSNPFRPSMKDEMEEMLLSIRKDIGRDIKKLWGNFNKRNVKVVPKGNTSKAKNKLDTESQGNEFSGTKQNNGKGNNLDKTSRENEFNNEGQKSETGNKLDTRSKETDFGNENQENKPGSNFRGIGFAPKNDFESIGRVVMGLNDVIASSREIFTYNGVDALSEIERTIYEIEHPHIEEIKEIAKNMQRPRPRPFFNVQEQSYDNYFNGGVIETIAQKEKEEEPKQPPKPRNREMTDERFNKIAEGIVREIVRASKNRSIASYEYFKDRG